MSADSSSKFRQIIFPILIGILVGHLGELCVAFLMEFARCLLRGFRSSRLSWLSCWPWSSQSACWAWLPGWPCILSSSWAFFIHVPWIYGAKHSSLSKKQEFQKILPRLNFWTRFQIFGRHELFSVFFLNRIPKISYAHNFLAWISFRFSKKSWGKNYDSVFCLFNFLAKVSELFAKLEAEIYIQSSLDYSTSADSFSYWCVES